MESAPGGKGRFWKFAAAFVAVIFVAVAAVLAWETYQFDRNSARVKALADAMQKEQAENLARAMADTYGGATPQETLQMYIAAVEKGDYELASKYLVESNAQQDLVELNALTEKGNIPAFLEILNNAKSDSSTSDNSFSMKSEVQNAPYYFINFIKYPNGIWKITKI